MGCCLSTGGASSTGKDPNFPAKGESFNQKPKFENRAPPPSFEEETVKEVLSEISKPKPKPTFPVPRVESENKVLEVKPTVVEKIPEEETISFNKVAMKSPASTTLSAGIDDSEDVSEICSLSETVSTITDRREDEEEVRQPRVFRSPARMAPPARRDRVVGRSPSKRPDPSPRRRIPNPNSNPTPGGTVRMSRGRESGSGQPMGRPGSRPSPTRRDPGESSGRRSRSPAVNRSVTGRSPSVKRANQSPARVRADPGEIGNGRKLVPENTNSGEKWPSSHQNATNSAPNESLDNPLVSLECFIFL